MKNQFEKKYSASKEAKLIGFKSLLQAANLAKTNVYYLKRMHKEDYKKFIDTLSLVKKYNKSDDEIIVDGILYKQVKK